MLKAVSVTIWARSCRPRYSHRRLSIKNQKVNQKERTDAERRTTGGSRRRILIAGLLLTALYVGYAAYCVFAFAWAIQSGDDATISDHKSETATALNHPKV